MLQLFRLKCKLIILLILSIVILTGKGSLYLTPIEEVSVSYLFSLSDWEAQNIFNKWLHVVKVKFNTPNDLVDDNHNLVYDYLDILNAEQNIITHTQDRSNFYEDELLIDRNVKHIRDSLEWILEEKLSEVLVEEDIGYLQPFGIAKIHFPPVDIRIQSPPKLLVVSPRNRIDLIETVLLKSDMNVDEIESLEDVLFQKFDLSVLILDLGGIATYPSLLPQGKSLESLLIVAAHEWLHHYIFFKPLGRKYWSDSNMTVINETLASMFGEDIGHKVYEKFQTPIISIDKGKRSNVVDGFDFRKELNQTRRGVDEFLSEGEPRLAELYMEERRRFINNNGYYIRKLNQAYFAFNGTYADHPGSVSPIGSQLKQIKDSSDSLSDFVNKVSQVSDYEEFLHLVDDQG